MSALVTGAANGIGHAVAEELASQGAVVAGVDREPFDAASPVEYEMQYDLADLETVAEIVARAEAALGRLDVLVNVAGMFEPQVVTNFDLASYQRTIDVNLTAPIILATSAATGMAQRGYGRILNISSVHADVSEVSALAYDTSKAGLNGATRTMAIELASYGVLVNAVAPGFVRTRMSVVDGVDELESDAFKSVYIDGARLPLRRAASPEEIAVHVAWLCSDRNTYITGQVITVDGGLTVTF